MQETAREYPEKMRQLEFQKLKSDRTSRTEI